MKKCDLHIHTIPTVSDSHFEFSLDVLEDYVNQMQLDVIAITNHNMFDMTQYIEIRDRLSVKTVLPGIEVDIEKGHLLVIFDKDDAGLMDFQSKCDAVTTLIPDNKTYITYEQFLHIFGDLTKYVLIPHYDKKPALSNDVISKFNVNILAGEVTSIKKFIYMLKDENERLTPVRFSDIRIKSDLSMSDYSTNHTFMDIIEADVRSIRHCLMDKTKVSLSKEDGNNLFEIFSNGQKLSTGLNIMYGKRSSGKTYTLNKIAELFGDKAKYIKQFELLKLSNRSVDQFEDEQRIRQQKYVDNYFHEFRNVVEDFVQVDSPESDSAILNEYAGSLVESAKEVGIKDEYSKAKLFSPVLYNISSTTEIEKLIKSVKNLLDSNSYRDIIDRHVSVANLKALLKELIDLYHGLIVENHYKEAANTIIVNVRNSLQRNSAAPRVPDINLYEILVNAAKRNRFVNIVNGLQKTRIINKEKVGNFTIKVSTRKFNNATDLKSVYNKQCSLQVAYNSYGLPMDYMRKLLAANIDIDCIYKMFVAVEFEILNSSDLPVSGGERSEFNFIQKIQDSALSDILIIDEPESSFDNIFLKQEVNRFIKNMAEIMPVVVSTHNNTIGRSIKPDYVLYTEKKVVEGKPVFSVYSGYPASIQLTDTSGNVIENYSTTLNSLEAGEDAYNERKTIYETLKN